MGPRARRLRASADLAKMTASRTCVEKRPRTLALRTFSFAAPSSHGKPSGRSALLEGDGPSLLATRDLEKVPRGGVMIAASLTPSRTSWRWRRRASESTGSRVASLSASTSATSTPASAVLGAEAIASPRRSLMLAPR